MDQRKNLLDDLGPEDLRQKAEARLAQLDVTDQQEMSPEQMRREIQLKRIEIELQKEQIDRYKQQLKQSRQRYRDLYFNAPVGYVSLDEEGIVGESNYMAAELLGANRESIADTPLRQFLKPCCHRRLREHIDNTLDNPGVHQCELQVELPTDTTTFVRIMSIAVEDDETGRKQCRSALFDVTDKQRAHEKTEQLEEQLQHSHRLQTIGRLAGGIAHDFNNLLTLIIGYSKLAINQLPEDHSLEKHVRQINKAGHHAGELIDQLLAFSRADDTRRCVIEPNELIDEMETMFDRLIGDDIELHTRLQAPLGSIQFDTAQFKQVLLNLVVNARDAMSEGGNLYIRTRNVTLTDGAAARIDLDGGPHVVVEVEDEGDGIPPEVIPHIFKPFFTTKSTENNHGFGLSTTYGIVRRHGGAIDVVSDPDSGTTFCIYLPRVDESNIDDEQEQTRDVVLVVDDQPDLRDFASLVIEELDVEVLTAPSPEEAVQLSQACGPELALVVTDVTMPGLSGPQLFKRIRRVHPNAEVLYISGYDLSTLQQDTDIDPDAPLLKKPFSPDKLQSKVTDLIGDPDRDD